MRKVKVTLRPGSTGKAFVLFPDPESLYLWACALERGEQLPVEGKDELVLDPGSFIEAELIGFEYVYDGQTNMNHKRLDWVRLGKAHEPGNASGLQVSTHCGWVTGNMFPLRHYSDAHVDVRPLDPQDAILDFPSLFSDDAPT